MWSTDKDAEYVVDCFAHLDFCICQLCFIVIPLANDYDAGDFHHLYVWVEDVARHSRGSCKGDQKSKRSQRRTLSLSSQSEKGLDVKEDKIITESR